MKWLERLAFTMLILISCAMTILTVLAIVNPAHAGSGGYTPTEQACLQELGDHLVIAKARIDGRTIEEVKAGAKHPEPDRTRVMALVDEAYGAEDPKAWFQQFWFACLDRRKSPPGLHQLQDREARCEQDAAVAQRAAEIAIAEPDWPIQTFAFTGHGERRLVEWVVIAEWAVAMVKAQAEPDAHAIGKAWYQRCIDRWQKTSFSPVKSESLVKPQIIIRRMCNAWAPDAQVIAWHVARETPAERLLDYAGNPESPEWYRERVREWIADAYAYEGSPQAWYEHWAKQCLAGKYVE